MKRLDPIVKRSNGVEPLTVRYKRVSEVFIIGDDKVKYREKLMGPDLIAGVPEEYSTLKVIEKVGFGNWQKMSLSDRGKWLAYYELEGMSELLREHMRIQKQQEEELKNKHNK